VPGCFFVVNKNILTNAGVLQALDTGDDVDDDDQKVFGCNSY